MLFIREYNAKSLDRSSVSMIDKYNTRLNTVGELLDRLSSLINNLLSLIRDIRNILGQSKQRIYDNLDQVKEVIDGNGITGTEATIKTIEDALDAGDKAIDEAETTLDNVGRAIECSEEYISDTNGNANEECGETCNETPQGVDDNCGFCNVTQQTVGEDDIKTTTCQISVECQNDLSCDEHKDISGMPTTLDGCDVTIITNGDGTYTSATNEECNETITISSCAQGLPPGTEDGCIFNCTHSSSCHEDPMPNNCAYTCIDGEGCDYDGDCSYGTLCGQADSCNQSDCGQYDCGEPCGETCHMTTDDDGDCSETSCGECSDDLSDDDYYGGDDGDSDMCGEDCGDSCGL